MGCTIVVVVYVDSCSELLFMKYDVASNVSDQPAVLAKLVYDVICLEELRGLCFTTCG